MRFTRIIYILGSSITVLCTLLCLYLFIICKSKDKQGKRVELQSKSREKPWSLGTWIAGVFVAGTGVALMYAPSDLTRYVREGLNSVESILMMSLLNGIPVWSLYAIVGLWYMNYMDSKIGKIAAILSTILGMSVSLFTGMKTVSRFLGISLPGLNFILAFITVFIAMLSAYRGWLKNISRISFLVFILAFLVLISSPRDSVLLTNIDGSITSNFFESYFLGETSASWIFWFISWTPTVSRWLAHISKGRTMREYILGTIVLPMSLSTVWMIVSWRYQDMIVNSFNMFSHIDYIIPCTIFILSGLLFMIGTLDSDCKVFTEDLRDLSKGSVNTVSSISLYGVFVLFFFCLFNYGIIVNPFAFNEYSSLIFVPLVLFSVFYCIKSYSRRY